MKTITTKKYERRSPYETQAANLRFYIKQIKDNPFSPFLVSYTRT
jgi:hypothetical protein